MSLPNAEDLYCPEPAYLRGLIARIQERRGLSQADIARRLGISLRRLEYLIAGVERRRRGDDVYEVPALMRYTEQFALEALAK